MSYSGTVLAKTSSKSWRKHSIPTSTKKLTQLRNCSTKNFHKSTTNRYASFSTISLDDDFFSDQASAMFVARPFYINLVFGTNCKQRALIDTGAFCSAMSQSTFDDIINLNPSMFFQKHDPPKYKVSVTSRAKVEVLFQVDLKFQLGNKNFLDRFLILPDMNDILLGLPFLDKNNVVVDCKRCLLRSPDFFFFIHSLSKKEKNFSKAKNKF